MIAYRRPIFSKSRESPYSGPFPRLLSPIAKRRACNSPSFALTNHSSHTPILAPLLKPHLSHVSRYAYRPRHEHLSTTGTNWSLDTHVNRDNANDNNVPIQRNLNPIDIYMAQYFATSKTQLLNVEDHHIVLYARYATRSPCGTSRERPNLTILLTATVRYHCRYCRELSLSACIRRDIARRSGREKEKCSEKGEKEGTD